MDQVVEDQAVRNLDALAAATQKVVDQNPDPEDLKAQADQQQAQAVADAGAAEWGMMVFAIGGVLQMLAPELKPVYSEDACLRWGQHANQVATKWGWNVGGHMPELALLASTLGFVVPSYLVISAKMRDAKQAQDGTLVGRIGLWWRNRKAQRQQAKAPQQQAPEVAANGSNE